MIEITHLSKSYGRSRGITDISLEVRKGDIFGFIGSNGAGKSTTIRILLNLIFPTSGSARIMGLDVVRDSKKIRRNIGYIPADARLYDKMKVREFLEYCAAFYRIANSRESIEELAARLDLDTDRKVHELSTGNRKKVTIIQALVHHPEILILDEPTSGLDPLIQSKFLDLLHEENQKGTTIFFSSHILSEVQAFCRTVAIVKEGRIVTVEEIASLRKKQLHRVRVSFPLPRSLAELGITGAEAAGSLPGTTLEFMFSGDINQLIGRLSAEKVESLTIEQPPLEEIFLHYYKS